jgi:hypothetical protein
MVSSKIGTVVTHESIEGLAGIIKSTLNEFPRQKLQELRDETLVNFGNSAPCIVQYIIEAVDKESTPGNQTLN